MDRITTALVALARAVPGVRDVAVYLRPDGTAHVTLSAATDEAALLIAAQAEVAPEYVKIVGADWIRGSKEIGDVTFTVEGPHHRRQPVAEFDAAAVDAAIEQADAAFGGAL